MNKTILVLLTLLSFIHRGAHAASSPPSCGGIHRKLDRAPACPRDGGLLPDLYPAAAVTVSDIDGGPAFAQSVVEKVLAAQPDAPPEILLNVSSSTMKKLRAHVEKIAAPEQKEMWLSALTRVNAKGRAHWQQDFFQDFADPTTGKPELRYVTGYERRGEPTKSVFKGIAKAMEACGGKVGKALPFSRHSDGTPVSGAFGGNLEAAPAFCMVGSDHFTSDAAYAKYAKEVCGNRPQLKPPTSWLEVGHTDEIFKAIAVPNREPPCNVAYMIASPRKARELFSGARAGEPAFKIAKKLNLEEARDFFWATEGFDVLCSAYLKNKASTIKNPPIPKSRPPGAISMFSFLPSAEAATKKKKQKVQDPTDFPTDCQDMTNADLLAASEEYREFNDLVQTELDGFQEQVRAQIKAATPQCEPDILEVPSLFSGEIVKGKKGKPNRLSTETGASIFPNPTNSITLAPAMISSDPYNDTIKTYLDAELSKRGLKNDYVDTMFSHIAGGNLHCSTQTMRYCKPAM